MHQDTIVALASGSGGAIAVIRMSGSDSISICDKIFRKQNNKPISQQNGFTIHYGNIIDAESIIDDVIVSLFRAPKSYTGEDMIEISCHASGYIKSEIINLCIRYGARSATAGEFTMRAFLNGKMDLSQAEAVADIISSENRASHKIASNQMRGGYSSEFNHLRDKLIEVSSLLELELDFSEEDVEFADRTHLSNIVETIKHKVETLLNSFKFGNIIKNGIPIAIVGRPNVGKSTLLNAILNEEKAIVSDIAGTTRDIIEDTLNINGVAFRFIDTAGIRHSNDPLENLGIERTHKSIEKASIILLVVTPDQTPDEIAGQIYDMQLTNNQIIQLIVNKSDLLSTPHDKENKKIFISAKNKQGIDNVINYLSTYFDLTSTSNDSETIVFNIRHYNSLNQSLSAVTRAKESISLGLSNDLLSQDIHEIIHHISTITGEITTDDVLKSIFSKFCIGK